MTRKEFDSMEFDDAMEVLYETHDCITTEDNLIDFIKYNLDKKNYCLAKHILDGIWESTGDSGWYHYDYTGGTLCNVTLLNNADDIEACGCFDQKSNIREKKN